MDNMNFNQNDNFYGPLFDNNNGDSLFTNENEIFKENQNDLPPELGEIRNLSEATIMHAPTMDALGPANFVKEDQTLVNDPLDLYERNGFVKNESEIPLSSFEQNNLNGISQSLSTDFTTNSFNESNPFEPINQENNFNVPVNNELEINNYEIINNSLEQDTSNNIFSSNSYNENDFSSNLNSTELNNFSVLSGESNINGVAISNDYEIINKSLVEDKIEEHKILEGEDANELLKTKVISDLSSNDNITDISSLGIDEIYAEPDSLEIIDTDLFDEEEQINNTYEPELLLVNENSNEEIESIKKLVEDLKAKGKNIKIEEFDFENMHQLIIIMEK